MKIGMSLQMEPPTEWESKEKDCCSICERTLELDNIYEQYRWVDGLGRTCLTCFMNEVESTESEEFFNNKEQIA